MTPAEPMGAKGLAELRAMRAAGWTFRYNRDTWYVLAEHPSGLMRSTGFTGNVDLGYAIAELLNGIDADEVRK